MTESNIGVVSGVISATESESEESERFHFLPTPLTTPSLAFRLWSSENQIVGVGSRSGRINQSQCRVPDPPACREKTWRPTPLNVSDGVVSEIGTLFSLHHKLYASDYDSDSDSDSVASENQPLKSPDNFIIFLTFLGFYGIYAIWRPRWLINDINDLKLCGASISHRLLIEYWQYSIINQLITNWLPIDCLLITLMSLMSSISYQASYSVRQWYMWANLAKSVRHDRRAGENFMPLIYICIRDNAAMRQF